MAGNDTRNLNIVMFGHKRIPSREGGIEVVVEELATRMVAKGHNVTCYNRTGRNIIGDRQLNRKEYKGVKIKEVFTIERKGFAAMTSSLFAAINSAFSNADVVHIHAEGPAFFSFIPKLFKKKVVVTVHGLDWMRGKWGRFASWYIKCGEKNAVRFADDIIVLSHSMQDYFKNQYGRNTTYIPNGVNKPQILEANEITDKWGLEKDSYVLFLGRLVPEKGVHYLIEAFKGIENKKLVIVGEGSDSKEYEDDLKKTANNVIFTGFQDGRVLEELYSNAYLYCLPSDVEGMPLSLLEAMSYGNCCLTSDIAECTEVVEDKAVVFRKGNIDDLREKLKMLCENTEIVQKYKDEARKYILDKYNWDHVLYKTLNLYFM